MQKKRNKRKRIMILGLVFFVVVFGAVLFFKGSGVEEHTTTHIEEIIPYTAVAVGSIEADYCPITSEAPVVRYEDPNNYIYPYNTMSADWGAEVYSSGFRYYKIPDEYVRDGGCFPEVVQVYLWCLCEDKGIDYYTMLALIERESNYRYDASGDDGNSKGYMQIQARWNKKRMEDEGVTDLYNPYGNIRVGLNLLQEIEGKYLESSGIHCVLMVYNMGESGAKDCWKQGIYSTEYTRAILARAEEIRQEIEQE